jgi:hypothetical protein
MRRSRLIVAAVGVALAVGLVASADAGVMFDPDGNLGPRTPIDLGAFDWAPTGFLARGGNAAVANFSSGACVADPTPCQLTVLTQARLVGTFDQNANNNTPAGLGQDFEITLIAGFREEVISVIPPAMPGGGAVVVFQSRSAPEPDFLRIFFDPTPNANQLTGGGFNDLAGGAEILSSSFFGQATGIFTTQTGVQAQSIDRFGLVDDYPGQLTLVGFGTQTNIEISNLETNPNFFLTPLASVGLIFENISTGLPFASTQPMGCFTQLEVGPPSCTEPHVVGPFSAQPVQGGTSYSPLQTGIINGLFGEGSGPDFTGQTDFNSPVIPAQVPPPVVPAPATLILLGLGLGAAWLAGTRRTR